MATLEVGMILMRFVKKEKKSFIAKNSTGQDGDQE